jgi:hypothetical protein
MRLVTLIGLEQEIAGAGAGFFTHAESLMKSAWPWQKKSFETHLSGKQWRRHSKGKGNGKAKAKAKFAWSSSQHFSYLDSWRAGVV